jgi:hypothetical protein
MKPHQELLADGLLEKHLCPIYCFQKSMLCRFFQHILRSKIGSAALFFIQHDQKIRFLRAEPTSWAQAFLAAIHV